MHYCTYRVYQLFLPPPAHHRDSSQRFQDLFYLYFPVTVLKARTSTLLQHLVGTSLPVASYKKVTQNDIFRVKYLSSAPTAKTSAFFPKHEPKTLPTLFLQPSSQIFQKSTNLPYSPSPELAPR